MSAKAKHEIDLIREYRMRLVANVVTGKVDVQHLAPALGTEPVKPEELVDSIDDNEMQTNDEPKLVRGQTHDGSSDA
jgi:type I restriction enzyme, S subunit